MNQIPYLLMGCNHSWKVVRTTYHVALDEHHIEDMERGQWRTDLLISYHIPKIPDQRTLKLHLKPKEWPFSPRRRFHGFSGTIALEFAIWMGCDPIYLLAFDQGNKQGKFDELEKRLSYANQRTRFAEIKRDMPQGKRVFNCNPHSALKVFDFLDPQEIFSG